MPSDLIQEDEALKLFQYEPSFHVAITFTALFASTTLIHIIQLRRYRAYCFTPFIIGVESVGYSVRAQTNNDQDNLGLFLTQTLLLLLGPALFATTIYMILGRIILFTRAEHLSPIPVSWLTKIFICADVLSFIVQSAGGGLMAQISTVITGKDIVVLGLLLQILFFGIFASVASLFHYRIFRYPTPISTLTSASTPISTSTPTSTFHCTSFASASASASAPAAITFPHRAPTSPPWQRHIIALYTASFLILTRSLFRVAEFMDGRNGKLMSKEWYLYVFDSVLMLAVMVCFNIIHPGRVVGRRSRWEREWERGRRRSRDEYAARDGNRGGVVQLQLVDMESLGLSLSLEGADVRNHK